MFWKIYFGFITLISIPFYFMGSLPILLYYGPLSRAAYEWEIDLISMIFTLMSLFGLAWKRRVILKQFWQVFFFISSVWNLGHACFTYDGTFTIVMTCIYLPSLLATYLYAFRSPDIWKRHTR